MIDNHISIHRINEFNNHIKHHAPGRSDGI